MPVPLVEHTKSQDYLLVKADMEDIEGSGTNFVLNLPDCVVGILVEVVDNEVDMEEKSRETDVSVVSLHCRLDH